MNKPEALVDTCFLHKFSKEGKNIELLKEILQNLDFQPVIHPYIWKNELEMYSYTEKLKNEGLIRIASYEEFLFDEDDTELYAQQFRELYKHLGEYYKMTDSIKTTDDLPDNCDIFTYRKAETSIGDVHVILMAAYMDIPVIFTEDGDISALRSIAKNRISNESYQMEIYNALDALELIIKRPDCIFEKKEIEKILNEIKERPYRSHFKQMWDTYHGDNNK